MKKSILHIFKILIILYIVVCGLLYFIQEKLIFFPDKLKKEYKFGFNQNFEELLNRASNIPRLTPQLAEQILKQIEELDEVPYDLTLSAANEIDKDIYSM